MRMKERNITFSVRDGLVWAVDFGGRDQDFGWPAAEMMFEPRNEDCISSMMR